MLEHMIMLLEQGKFGWIIWGVTGVVGLIATMFAMYYISFAIYLIGASIYSGFKLIPESYRIWREDRAAAYVTSWGGAELGVTMPDGGEPVDEKEEEKEA